MIVVKVDKYRQEILEYLAVRGYVLWLENGLDLFMVDAQSMRVSSDPVLPDVVNYNGSTGKQPYDEIQTSVEMNIHSFVNSTANDIESLVIVGGYLGFEIDRILKTYPNIQIHVFEASPRYFQPLSERYSTSNRVFCHNFAVSDRNGTAQFHETSLEGNGSLLSLKETEDSSTWIATGAKVAESYCVQTLRLDDFALLSGNKIDVLWCDVQGHELNVLQGAPKVLQQCKAVFLEVATYKTMYNGQCLFDELNKYLEANNFSLRGIGLCNSGNGTGNALWVNKSVYDVTQCSTQHIDEIVAFDAIKTLINPHLIAIHYLPKDKPIFRKKCDSFDLFTTHRFDIGPKYIYAEHRKLGINSPWSRKLYEAHLRAFNDCHEDDGSGKSGIDAFTRTFDSLLDSIETSGFDTSRSLVPTGKNGVIIDAAHRIAACMLHHESVEILEFDILANNYNYEYFLQKGLDPEFCDAIALKYCIINPNSYIVMVFPSAVGKEDEVRAILTQYSEIFYDRKVHLTKLGSINLVRQIYVGEPWVGNFANQFAGAQNKAVECFRSDRPVRVYVITSDDFDNVKIIKQQIRDLFGISNHSVHINDTHQETIMLGQLLLNSNSVHFLNNAQLNTFPKFQTHLENYKKILLEQGVNGEYLCIDGSASMAAYGIREARDLDYLHFGYDHLTFDYPPELIGSHNSEIAHHVTTRDDIIFNPRNHFYYDGVKFASLGIIRALKQKRGEPKDIKDIALIDQFVNTPPALPHVYSTNNSNQSSDCAVKAAKPTKIVGLVPARNERHLISQCLRALALFTDAIVYLDDASTDETPQIVEALSHECRIERIIRKKEWFRDEPGDRNQLLQAGREIGGTHFIVIDADEMLSSNLLDNACLTEAIRKLQLGDRLALNWIQLWRSIDEYRFDNSVWTWNYKEIIFCDDGHSSYTSEFIHTPRVPEGLTGRSFKLEGYFAGLLHFQFAAWRNLLIKQSWYRCLERIREPNKSIVEINQRYAPSKDETGLALKPSPRNWFYGYPFFDRTVFDLPEEWREEQILGWIDQYGREFFAGLDIWDLFQDGLAGQVNSKNLADEPPTKKLATSNSDNNRLGPADISKVTSMRSNLEYWKELQNKGYFENQNPVLLEDLGEEKYQNFYGTTDPKKPRNTSEKDREHIARFLTLDKSMTAAIIGCGYGRETLAIAPQVKHVYGIDVNHTILEKTQEYLAGHDIYNFTPILAEKWNKLVPGTIDFVYSIMEFQYLPRDLVMDYLAGLAKKLSPTGKALCQFAEFKGGTSDAELKAYGPSVNWSTSDISSAMTEAGLSLVTLRTIEVDKGVWHWAFFERRNALHIPAAPSRADLKMVHAGVSR